MSGGDEMAKKQMKNGTAIAEPEWAPAALVRQVNQLPGYQEAVNTAAAAFNKACEEANDEMEIKAHTFLNLVISSCKLWIGFRIASRHRLEDRANDDAPGKVSGEDSSVSTVLGLGRNAVYNRLDKAGLRAQDFAYLPSVTELVQRGSHLRQLRDELLAYMRQAKKPTKPSAR